jgi:polysaccharide biosynthesis protein PslH
MNILLICNKSPWPPKEGGPIAMNAIAEGLLAAGHKVKILAINSFKYNIDPDTIPSDFRDKTGIELVFIDLKVKPWLAFINLFTRKSFHVERFISSEFAKALSNILIKEHFDIIQLETLFVTPYIDLIKKYSQAPVILRAHNIEHLIWQRLYKGEKNPVKKWYLGHLAKTLRNYELGILKQLDGIVTITANDSEYFGKYFPKEKICPIPFGIQPELIEKYTKGSGITREMALFHLGSMNWLPNQEGIKWFIKKVWPILASRHKELVFRLAGREMPDWLLNMNAERIIIDGDVDDAIEYMHKFSIMIVPLFSGSGIRIKIIEGMMSECAIITTRIGAEGIMCEDGKHLLLAENAEEFAESVTNLLSGEINVVEIGKNAREFIQKHHNNKQLISELESFYLSRLD